MNEHIEDRGSESRADEDTVDKVVPPRPRRLFQPGYFANNGWAIFLFGLAVLFLGVLLPVSEGAKNVYLVILVLCLVVLLAHGIYSRNAITSEDIEEEFRDRTQSALNALTARVDMLGSHSSPRRLDPSARAAIVATLRGDGQTARFAIRFSRVGGDCGQLAKGIHLALEEAGWTLDSTLPEFDGHYPFVFIVSKHNLEARPAFAGSLAKALKGVGIEKDGVPTLANDNFPDDAIGIFIGPRA